jgi:hypothetical protein
MTDYWIAELKRQHGLKQIIMSLQSTKNPTRFEPKVISYHMKKLSKKQLSSPTWSNISLILRSILECPLVTPHNLDHGIEFPLLATYQYKEALPLSMNIGTSRCGLMVSIVLAAVTWQADIVLLHTHSSMSAGHEHTSLEFECLKSLTGIETVNSR